MWSVESQRDDTVAATSTWGTTRVPASAVAQHVLEQRPIRVFDTYRAGGVQRRVPNLEETVAANEKAAEMRERFAEWVWEDPARTAELVRTYNDTFNSYVLRSYTGVQLSLPGLATTFQPRPHQLAAVARVVNEPGVGLYHAVGAGKTAVMIMGAMELRRLGLVSKPVIVVPNNLLAQFAREFQQLYPRAKLLAATKDDLRPSGGGRWWPGSPPATGTRSS
jgi:N12 class adenine-specific DNA methylase